MAAGSHTHQAMHMAPGDATEVEAMPDYVRQLDKARAEINTYKVSLEDIVDLVKQGGGITNDEVQTHFRYVRTILNLKNEAQIVDDRQFEQLQMMYMVKNYVYDLSVLEYCEQYFEKLQKNWNKISQKEVSNLYTEISDYLRTAIAVLHTFLAARIRYILPECVDIYAYSEAPDQVHIQFKQQGEKIMVQRFKATTWQKTIPQTRILLSAFEATIVGMAALKASKPIDAVLDQLKLLLEQLTDPEFLGVRYSFNKLRLFCRIQKRLVKFFKKHFNGQDCQEDNSTSLIKELLPVMDNVNKAMQTVQKCNNNKKEEFTDEEQKYLLQVAKQLDFITKTIVDTNKDKAYEKIEKHLKEIFPPSMETAATSNHATTSAPIAQEQEVQAAGPSENVQEEDSEDLQEEDLDTWLNKGDQGIEGPNQLEQIKKSIQKNYKAQTFIEVILGQESQKLDEKHFYAFLKAVGGTLVTLTQQGYMEIPFSRGAREAHYSIPNLAADAPHKRKVYSIHLLHGGKDSFDWATLKNLKRHLTAMGYGQLVEQK